VLKISRRFEERTKKYRQNFEEYGYSELSMDMPSDRRTIRYYELIKNFEFFQSPETEKSFILCDAGCGFGDINAYLQKLQIQNYSYIGLDVVDEFLETGRKKYGSPKINYLKRNFITDDISDLQFDYVVSSQTFTIPYTEANHNYPVIFESIQKLFQQCKKGVSFNFYTDKGQFQRPDMAYHDPVKILEIAYSLSTNVILDNSCFPFECTITILKDNERTINGMLFDRFLRIHKKEFDDQIFVVKKEQKDQVGQNK